MLVKELIGKINNNDVSRRVGKTIGRISKMREANVTYRDIAMQMTDNDIEGIGFTEEDIISYEKLAKAMKCRTSKDLIEKMTSKETN